MCRIVPLLIAAMLISSYANSQESQFAAEQQGVFDTIKVFSKDKVQWCQNSMSGTSAYIKVSRRPNRPYAAELAPVVAPEAVAAIGFYELRSPNVENKITQIVWGDREVKEADIRSGVEARVKIELMAIAYRVYTISEGVWGDWTLPDDGISYAQFEMTKKDGKWNVHTATFALRPTPNEIHVAPECREIPAG